jgi:hypothetical protein
MQTHTRTRTCAHTNTYSRLCSTGLQDADAHVHTHTHTHTHAYTHTQAHTHARAALAYKTLMPIPYGPADKISVQQRPGVHIEGVPLRTPDPVNLRTPPEAISGVLLARALLGLGELDKVGWVEVGEVGKFDGVGGSDRGELHIAHCTRYSNNSLRVW